MHHFRLSAWTLLLFYMDRIPVLEKNSIVTLSDKTSTYHKREPRALHYIHLTPGLRNSHCPAALQNLPEGK